MEDDFKFLAECSDFTHFVMPIYFGVYKVSKKKSERNSAIPVKTAPVLSKNGFLLPGGALPLFFILSGIPIAISRQSSYNGYIITDKGEFP